MKTGIRVAMMTAVAQEFQVLAGRRNFSDVTPVF